MEEISPRSTVGSQGPSLSLSCVSFHPTSARDPSSGVTPPTPSLRPQKKPSGTFTMCRLCPPPNALSLWGTESPRSPFLGNGQARGFLAPQTTASLACALLGTRKYLRLAREKRNRVCNPKRIPPPAPPNTVHHCAMHRSLRDDLSRDIKSMERG